MESKTYVFGENGNNGMMSLLAPLMQKSGLDPNLLLAMNRNNGGFGGEGGWFMWVIFLFFLMGWGGNGWGFGRNNGGGIANEINNDYPLQPCSGCSVVRGCADGLVRTERHYLLDVERRAL